MAPSLLKKDLYSSRIDFASLLKLLLQLGEKSIHDSPGCSFLHSPGVTLPFTGSSVPIIDGWIEDLETRQIFRF